MLRKSFEKQRSVLILSTGRTGTKWLANFLATDDEHVNVFHASKYTPLINILVNMSLAGLLPRAAVAYAWTLLKRKEVFSTSIYIDSNNHLYAFPGLFAHLYPNLKVVHVVREPSSYVRSHLNWALGHKKNYFANFILPFWHPSGFLLGEITFSRWIKMSRVQRFAWIWSFKNRKIRQLEESEIPYLCVKFENIFSDSGGGELERLCDFLELDPPKKMSEIRNIENSSDVRRSISFRLSDDDIEKVLSECRDEMAKYGYV